MTNHSKNGRYSRDFAGNGSISHCSHTLQELLDYIESSELPVRRLVAMLRSTATHLSNCLGKPPQNVLLTELSTESAEIHSYFKNHGFKRNASRSYMNFVRILYRTASDLGWVGADPEIESAWKPLITALPTRGGERPAASIIRYAVRNGIRPHEFGELQLAKWEEWMLRRERTQSGISISKRCFRRLVRAMSVETALQQQEREGGLIYRTPFDQLPEPLHSQLGALLEWKVAEIADGRPEWCRHRPQTAEQFKSDLLRLYGFGHTVRGQQISSLIELVNESLLRDFVKWYLNARRGSAMSLLNFLAKLYATVKRYPCLQLPGRNFDWLGQIIGQLPVKRAEAQKEVTEDRKWVDYGEINQIPPRIGKEKEKAKGRRAAILARNELIITWLTVLPWRRRNLVECKLGPTTEGGNLFKSELLPILKSGQKAQWVEEELKANPKGKFWQFYFCPEETKTGYTKRGILPRRLVAILEEYIQLFRPVLLAGHDPGSLLLSETGARMGAGAIHRVVCDITKRYTGRRINPHFFRHIFAVKWLEDHPEDYLSLSKILWHRNIQTTIQIYGRKFDESQGARRVDEWLGRPDDHHG